MAFNSFNPTIKPQPVGIPAKIKPTTNKSSYGIMDFLTPPSVDKMAKERQAAGISASAPINVTAGQTINPAGVPVAAPDMQSVPQGYYKQAGSNTIAAPAAPVASPDARKRAFDTAVNPPMPDTQNKNPYDSNRNALETAVNPPAPPNLGTYSAAPIGASWTDDKGVARTANPADFAYTAESAANDARRAAGIKAQEQADMVAKRNQQIEAQNAAVTQNIQDQKAAQIEAVRPWWAGGTKETADAGKANVEALQKQGAQLQSQLATNQHLAGVEYTGDRAVDAHKATGDATVKAHQIGADATVQAHKLQADAAIIGHKIGAEGKVAAQIAAHSQDQEKERNKLQKDIYDKVLTGYDFTGVSPAAQHDYATIMAKTAGMGYGTIADPSGKMGDALIHPTLMNNPGVRDSLAKIKNAQEFGDFLNMLEKHGGTGAVFRTPIRGTQSLKPIHQAKPDYTQQQG